MDTSEVEFLAERSLISIVPNFTLSTLHLISGDFGPFRAGMPTQVPIWVAVNLRQRSKCRILPPDWLNVETLENVKKQENDSRLFTKMPSEHFMEEAQMILSASASDIPRAGEVRVILKDIWDMRQSKLRASATLLLQEGGRHARVDHLTVMEINSIRPLLPHSLHMLRRLQSESKDEVSTQASNSQSQLDFSLSQ